MPDIRLIAQNNPYAVTLDWLQTPMGLLDETNELITAVTLALCTDALADPTDKLPDFNTTDRRGWWGDMDAAEIWNGWPIGSKLWLLKRAKILDSGAREGDTGVRIHNYIQDCLQPFVTARIVSSFTISVTQVNIQRMDAAIVLYRGQRSSIALQFQAAWDELFPAPDAKSSSLSDIRRGGPDSVGGFGIGISPIGSA